METKDTIKDTEHHIKDTAKHVFFVKGHLNAKMQEIADEAGVNRALLHYYFRNREKLLNTILTEAYDEVAKASTRILESNISFEQKIEEVVSQVIDRMIVYPYMETFIVTELLRKNPEEITQIERPRNEAVEKKFFEEVRQYIEDHNLPHIKPEHFFVNLMALCSYPSITQPLLKKTFHFNDEQFTTFISERKTVITKLLLGKK